MYNFIKKYYLVISLICITSWYLTLAKRLKNRLLKKDELDRLKLERIPSRALIEFTPGGKNITCQKPFFRDIDDMESYLYADLN